MSEPVRTVTLEELEEMLARAAELGAARALAAAGSTKTAPVPNPEKRRPKLARPRVRASAEVHEMVARKLRKLGIGR